MEWRNAFTVTPCEEAGVLLCVYLPLCMYTCVSVSYWCLPVLICHWMAALWIICVLQITCRTHLTFMVQLLGELTCRCGLPALTDPHMCLFVQGGSFAVAYAFMYNDLLYFCLLRWFSAAKCGKLKLRCREWLHAETGRELQYNIRLTSLSHSINDNKIFSFPPSDPLSSHFPITYWEDETLTIKYLSLLFLNNLPVSGIC